MDEGVLRSGLQEEARSQEVQGCRDEQAFLSFLLDYRMRTTGPGNLGSLHLRGKTGGPLGSLPAKGPGVTGEAEQRKTGFWIVQ